MIITFPLLVMLVALCDVFRIIAQPTYCSGINVRSALLVIRHILIGLRALLTVGILHRCVLDLVS